MKRKNNNTEQEYEKKDFTQKEKEQLQHQYKQLNKSWPKSQN